MINKKQLISDKFYYGEDDEVLVNALDLINLLIKDEASERLIAKLESQLEIMKLLIDIRETNYYTKVDLRV